MFRAHISSPEHDVKQSGYNLWMSSSPAFPAYFVKQSINGMWFVMFDMAALIL